ncbi:olfactory receptor 5AP2-like [Rhinophrynus dorsalis]
MAESNRTNTAIFILLGLSSSPHLRAVSFTVFISIYLMTLLGNVMVLTAVLSDARLHTPMYFFLANLSFLEICFTSATVPKILTNILWKINTISFQGCFCQIYIFTMCATTECLLLAIMAYDRYVAICIPLKYSSIMSQTLCLQFVSIAWISGIFNSTIETISTARLPFCLFNEIDRLYCEIQPLLRISCSDTHVNEILTSVAASVFGVGLMSFIMVSYIFIISAILRIPSLDGRLKALSTCSSHITVVSLYYGALSFLYLRPTSSDAGRMDSVSSVVYCMAIPVLNPIIYSLRNKDVKRAVRNIMYKILCTL